jgi:hypothetical protein
MKFIIHLALLSLDVLNKFSKAIAADISIPKIEEFISN